MAATLPRPASTADDATALFRSYAATGDVAALERVLERHADQASSQARRFLGNATDADDAVQEAFLQLVRTARRFDGTIAFGPWLGRLVHIACLRALRARGRHRRERPLVTSPAPVEPPPTDD